jgi:ATP-dependent Clp protease adaptor protein ClpS
MLVMLGMEMTVQAGLARGASVFLMARSVNTGFSVTSSRTGQIVGSAETESGWTVLPAEVGETSSGRLDRWAVVLINDDHHSADYVIWALLKTMSDLSSTDAALIMLETHNTGKGVVTLCGRGQAEEYRAALRLLQLGCEIEPGW